MPTKRRIWHESAAYHVTVRGNRKEDIFRSGLDSKYYLILLEEAIDYFATEKQQFFEIACYCLMTNHVHLLIKTHNEAPGIFMGRINSMYTKYFNKKYEYTGHLFQGKYHSEIISTEEQFLEVSRYIHLNPVRARMVQKPEQYDKSSYRMFIGERKENIINSEIILDLIRGTNKRSDYKKFVEAKMEEENQKKIVTC